jgi:23S rRNA pseudouridine1911/1915/1917 synthase
MTDETFSITVPRASEGQRLDRFLSSEVSGQSRSALRRFILEGLVTVDEQPVLKPGFALKAAMSVVVRFPPPPSDSPLPEDIPIEVVHQDRHIVVVAKPAGLVVHPGHGRLTGTLINALLGLGIRLSPIGAPDRPGIVHRLDLETSGLIVVAKSAEAHEALATAFAERRVKKRYSALVWGHPDPTAGRIEVAIGRSRANPVKMAVHSTRGRRRVAVSTYETIEHMPGFSLLAVSPETGRTHQIRVHMQSINRPIVGDGRYGGRAWRNVRDPLKRKALRNFERLALHASDLEFLHPATGEKVSFHAPRPPEFEALLDRLRQ